MNIIACDLGGTKALVGLYEINEKRSPILVKKERYNSNEWESFDSLLENFIKQNCNEHNFPEKACFGVAGTIIDNKSKLTNLPWIINGKKIKKNFNFNKVELINDFAVLIYGIPFLKESQYQILQKGVSQENNKYLHAIVGAGTGLGVSRGLILPERIEILCSEAGHTEFAPRSKEEWDLKQWLKEVLKVNRLSSEKIISGEGLINIAEWRLSKSDHQKHPFHELLSKSKSNSKLKKDLPSRICQISSGGDSVMREIENIWLSAYASFLGDIAIHELCFGGLWIAGGTAPKHIKNFESSSFLKHFSNKGRYEDILKTIPVKVILDEEFGLHSASCRAMMI